MRKTNKKLTLKTNTVRSLADSSLGDAGGALSFPSAASCVNTCIPTLCHYNTPRCPQ